MGNKSRETIYGASVRAAAERATQARKEADRLACEAWNKRIASAVRPWDSLSVGRYSGSPNAKELTGGARTR